MPREIRDLYLENLFHEDCWSRLAFGRCALVVFICVLWITVRAEIVSMHVSNPSVAVDCTFSPPASIPQYNARFRRDRFIRQ